MGIKCRHIVALIGFAVTLLLNSNRVDVGVAVVAMVNHSSYISAQDTAKHHSCSKTLNSSEEIFENQLEGEFIWSPKLQGYILGSSSLGYVLTQIAAGKLSETFGGSRVLLLGNLGASVCTLLSPFAAWVHVYFLIVVQFMRGIFQGFILASFAVLMANWFPCKERGSLSAFVNSGLCVGGLVGGALSGVLCQSSLLGGWPSVFYVFGGLNFLLSVIHAIFLYEDPKQHPRISEAELKFILKNQECNLSKKRPPTPWKKILTSVPVWALVINFFGQTWILFHILTIHSTYLGTILDLPIQQNGIFTSLPFALQTFSMWFASWFTNLATKREYLTANKIRKLWNFIACFSYSTCLLAIYASGCNKELNTIFFVLGLGLSGIGTAGEMSVPIDLSPTFAGTILGLCNFIGCMTGFLVPVVTGVLTNNEENLEQWHKIFFISIAVVMSSCLIFMTFGSAEVQPWNFSSNEDSSQKNAEDDQRNEENKSAQNSTLNTFQTYL